MANSLGTLSIDVLANIAGMVSDMGKAQAASAKASQAFQDQWTGAIGSVGDAFKSLASIAGVGISIAGLSDVAKQSLDAAERINNLSQSLGISTQSLQTMGFAAGLVGGNIDTASAAIAKMEKSGEQAAAGNAQATEAFRALGISAGQLPALLKDPDELMQQLASNVANLGDGSAKTAAIMQVFGKGAAEIIPFLNELGTNYDQLRQRAEDFGVVLSSQDQGALTQAGEQLNELKEAASGAANEFTIAMLPAINAIAEALESFAEGGGIKDFFAELGTNIGEAVTIAGQAVDEFETLGEVFHDITGISGASFSGMKGDLVAYIQQSLDEWAQLKGFAEEVWINIKEQAAIQWAEVQNVASIAVHNISIQLADLLDQIRQFAVSTGNIDAAVFLGNAEQSVLKFANSLPIATADLQGFKDQILAVQTQTNSEIAANQQWADGTRLTTQSLSMMTAGMDEFADSLTKGDLAGNAKLLQAAIANLNSGSAELIANGADAAKVQANEATTISQLTQMVTKADAAQVSYNAKVGESVDTTGKLAQELLSFSQFMDGLNAKVGDIFVTSMATFNKSIDEADTRILKMLGDGLSLADAITLDAQATDAATAAMNASIAADVTKNDLADDMIQKLMDEGAQLTAVTTAQQAQLQVQELVNKALQTNRDLYGQQYDTLAQAKTAIDGQTAAVTADTQALLDQNQQLKLNQQAAKDWENIWAQAGDGIASTFSKILVEGGSLFDSLKSLAQQTVEAIIQYFAKLEVINPILNAIFGGQSGFSLLPTMENAAGSAAISSGSSSIFGAGVDVAEGANFASTAAGGTQFSIMNPSTWIAAGKSMYSGFTGMFDTSGYTMGPPTMAGSTSSFAPGYTSGFGQALGVAGGVYAGYNEYQAAGGGAGGIAGAAAYGVGTYFAGAAGSAALSGGLAAGFAAIPVVGWIALAAMAVNWISGGKLFGTSGKVVGGSSTTTVGSSGIDLSSEYTTKSEGALFSGASWDQHSMPVDPAAQAAADQFFAQLKTGTAAFAKEFGTTMGDIVGGTFQQTFDQNGKVTGSTTTIAGHTYSGETQDQFTEREIAENEIAVLSKFDSNLSASIDQYRTDADTLGAVVNALAQGEAEMQAGTKFLALGSDQSLSALLKLAQGSEQFGETIDQTLQRIEQAQASYDQFVGQFKPAATYVDDFEASLAGIQSQMMANIKQANALAVAAGAAGASETDLANIHQYAAAQAAAAIATLEASAQSLAFNLGITNTGSLDQVNAEIQQLESEAGTGASAVQSFGNVMATAAQKATDAINLLLGTDSPLNDQQKLQEALAGLKAGTVSQTAVLDIGRRLYASSQAYTDLFNEVQQFPGLQSGGSAASGGGSAAGGHGLSSADQQRLQELLKEQATLQAGQTLAQYQTLAQQIAEIASAKGETFQQVIDEMGIKDADLEKGLGIKSDADLNAYLSKIQDQTDSNGDNTMSIVAVLNKIYDVLSGTPDNPTRNGGTLNVPTGHGTPAAPPGMTPSDIRQLGQAFAQAVAPVIGGPRNLRPIRA